MRRASRTSTGLRALAVWTLAMMAIALGSCDRAAAPPGGARVEPAPDARTEAIPPAPKDLAALDPRVADLIGRRYGAVVATPEDPDAWMAYGLALHANEVYDGAADAYRRVVALGPDRARAWYLLGRVATRLGESDAALAAFGEASALAPDYAPALWRPGMLLLDLGRPDAALPLFERAVSIEGTVSAGGLGRARAWIAAGRIDDAITALETCSADDAPNAGYAANLLASAYRRAGRFEEAAKLAGRDRVAEPVWPDPWVDALAEHRPGYGARIAQARALISAGRYAEAASELEALRAEHPENVTVLTNLGIAYRQRGRFTDSVAVLDAALEQDETFFLAHFHLAVALAEHSSRPLPGTTPSPPAGDPVTGPTLRRRARHHLSRALALNPTYAPGYSLRGDLARLEGRPSDALADYREAARCEPLDPRWPFRIGVTLLDLERWDEAATALARAVEVDPRDAEARRALAVATMNLGHFDAAARALDDAERLAPGDERVGATRRQLERRRAGADGGGT